MSAKPHVLYVVNVDWFFLSHRLPIAKAALDAGAKVTVAAGATGRGQDILSEGLEFIPLPMSRKGTNPLSELKSLLFLYHLYRTLRPSLVHHVSIKPVLYGSIAARFIPDLSVVNAITGLGFAFSARKQADRLRSLIVPLYRLALQNPHSRTIFQNPDDRAQFVRSKLIKEENAILIRGSGVDCAQYHPGPTPNRGDLVMLPSRMLWDKGIQVFVDAAKIVRQHHPGVRFVLVGGSDEGNPTAVSEAQLRAWATEGIAEWWGHRSDMPQVLAQASVVVLPTTYPEGVPKVLLEAAAVGCPIVATDVPGCREIVRPNINGFLVPPRDSTALAQAIMTILANGELRERFGSAGREIAVSEFAVELVVEQTLDLYRSLLGDRWPTVSTEA